MPTPVGRDWSRLPPLEQSRQILAAVLDIRVQTGDKYFVEAAGRILKSGPWPLDARLRAAPYAGHVGWVAGLFAQNGPAHVSLWEQLAEDLPQDPDFCAWVRNASRKRLRYNDEYTLRDVTVSFAHEGHACTVDHADSWYRARANLYGKYHETWIKQLEAKLGNKPIIRLVQTEMGDPPGKGERRGESVQGGYIGEAVTNVTRGDNHAAAAIFEREDPKSDDPAQIFLRQEQISELKAAIKRLPSDLSTILSLRLFEGRTRTEVGKLLGMSETTVTQKLQVALRQLHQLLQAPPSEDRS